MKFGSGHCISASSQPFGKDGSHVRFLFIDCVRRKKLRFLAVRNNIPHNYSKFEVYFS